MKRQEGTAKARRLAALRKRITKVQGKAKFVGVLYLLATIALLALSCFPVFTVDGTQEGWLYVLTFWQSFAVLQDMANLSVENVSEMIISGVYVFILLVLLVNVFRAFSKLNWLFKKKPSKQNGHNRNVYAMEDLGKIFSSSFFTVVFFNYILYLLLKANTLSFNLPNLIALAALGLFIHFVCGHIGGNVSLFVADGDVLIEEKRECGRVAPIVRNVLQLIAICGIAYLISVTCNVPGWVVRFLSLDVTQLLAEPTRLIASGLLGFAIFSFAVLVKHATNITEFDLEGVDAPGMKNFRVFSFIIFLMAGGAFAARYLLFGVLMVELAIMAGVAIVSFIIELIMKNMPGVPQEDSDEIDMDEYLASVSQNGFASQYGAIDSGAQYNPMSAYGLQPMAPLPQTNFGFENYYDISEEY